jgi:phosphoenolpyruvate---glycerone phosphotransferase subunit DhaL
MSDMKETIGALKAACKAVQAQRDYLSELDAAMGDGDHGVSMAKSFKAVEAMLDSADEPDIGALLYQVGWTLVSEVGGAMGPLFGTAFIRAGKAVPGQTEIGPADVARMLAAAEEGVAARGKAQIGDKTMLDALHAAAAAAAAAAEKGRPMTAVLAAAAAGAQQGAEATRDMVAKMGRASRLGERTLGHQDAGATSVAIILGAIHDHCSR